MNKAFVEKVKELKLSMYRLSKLSGVRYSVVNDLMNGKKDINNCSVETALRLSGACGVSVYDIINPVSVAHRISDKYRGILYTWEKDASGTMDICFSDNGKKVRIKTKYRFDNPKNVKLYHVYAHFYIDEYLNKKSFSDYVRRLKEKKYERSV